MTRFRPDSRCISFYALGFAIAASACGGEVASSGSSGASPFDAANVNLSPSDCALPETLATFTADSDAGSQLVSFSSMAIGSDGTVFVSSFAPALPAGASAGLPLGILAIPPDGGAPRSVTSDKRTAFGNVWVVGNSLYTFAFVYSGPTLSVVPANGAAPAQPIWSVASVSMIGYALDATGFYYASVASSAGDAGTSLSITRVSLDGTVVTTLGSSDVPSTTLGGSNVFLDEESIYLVDGEGLWSMPKGGGTITHVRSDVQASVDFSGLPTAAQSGTEFFAVGASSGLARFTPDPNVPPDPIAIASSAPWTNATPAAIVGDGQGVYALFTSGGSVSAPLVIGSVAGEKPQSLACFLQAGPQSVQTMAIDATYVYFSVQRSENLEIDVVRMHR
jgi:hypothetical protein